MADRTSLSRRSLLGRGAKLAGVAGLTAAAPVLTACGSSSSTTSGKLEGQIVMVNYPGWIGASEVKNFQKAHPGVTVKQVTEASGGNAAQAAQIVQNKGAFDFALAGQILATQLHDDGLLAAFAPATVPNLKNVPERYRTAFPYGIPTDQGKLGIAYRTDLLPNPPESWAEMFAMAPSLSGKIIFSNYDVDILGIALLSVGYSVNATTPAQLHKAKQVLIAAKPHIKAFLSTDLTKPMIQGSAVLTVCYDYDYAGAVSSSSKIGWIEPTEGMPAYIEGWVPLASSSKLPEVYAFMDYELSPAGYADYINTTAASYLLPNAAISKSITTNAALKFSSTAKVEYGKLLPAPALKMWDQIWQEVMAA
jgi:spermidine/putrescine-binding protein